MASIILQNVGGLVPRVAPHLLANGAATVASMTKLWSGDIRPFMDLGEVLNAPLPKDAPVLTVYLLIDKWLAWYTDVDVVTGFTTLSGSGRIYYTGDGFPKQTTYDLVRFGPPTPPDYVTFPIGVLPPQPAYTPSVAVIGVGTGDPLVRSYVYTLYTVNNEESVPSLPSAEVVVETGQTVNIGNFQDLTATSPDYPFNYDNVRSLRIYRTSGGEFKFVAVITAPFPPTYNDAILDQNLGEVLQSQHYYPPSGDIHGLIGLSCGSLAAFHGNKVAFSEPYQPGAWPPEYEKIFDYPVVALGTFGQTCIVATTGYTYLVSGNDPRSFAVARVPDPYPCVSKRSMVSGDQGCMYASADGLIFVGTASYFNAGRGVQVVTRNLMTYNEWQQYNPTTINGVIFDGRYYAFYKTPQRETGQPEGAGFIFDSTVSTLTGVVSESEYDRDNVLVDMNFFATATFANPQVPLHVVVNGGHNTPSEPVDNVLFAWEGGPRPRVYTWRSKQFSFPYIVTFSAAKIIYTNTKTTGLTFRLLDGLTGAVQFERAVTSVTPFRLPSLQPRTEWMVEVEGFANVEKIHVATSYQDIQEGK